MLPLPCPHSADERWERSSQRNKAPKKMRAKQDEEPTGANISDHLFWQSQGSVVMFERYILFAGRGCIFLHSFSILVVFFQLHDPCVGQGQAVAVAVFVPQPCLTLILLGENEQDRLQDTRRLGCRLYIDQDSPLFSN